MKSPEYVVVSLRIGFPIDIKDTAEVAMEKVQYQVKTIEQSVGGGVAVVVDGVVLA